MLALAACTTEYKLVGDGNSRPDGGDGDGDGNGDGDGDGDGQSGSGGGREDGGVVIGDGDGDGDRSPICERDGLCRQLPVTNTDKVDLLFMIDNSFSMEQEQASLREQFPRLINMLTSGDRNGDGVQDFPPANDVHFGVISSDLGLPGLEGAGIERCGLLGDEGRLLNVANPELLAEGVCSAQTFNPPFLKYDSASADDGVRNQLANDLACIATIGLEGCGFEQQLESMLKAVWPGADQQVTFVTDPSGFGMFGMSGPGFPNGEFIRNNPNEGLSVISLVMVTDEEDCSSRRMDHFVPGASANGLNTRCYYEGLRGPDSNLFQINRYIELFKMLRPGREDLVLFDAIVGVPPGLVDDEVIGDINFDDADERDTFYESVLNDENMQERIDDKGTPDVLDDDGLVPSCNRGEFAKAYPPRRIVQVAQGLGANGMVHSICQDSFDDPITSIVDRIGAHLGTQCLGSTLEREGGRVACDVYWVLPSSPTSGSPTSCGALDFLSSNGVTSNGRALCKVNQVEVAGGGVQGNDDGFYYDDFSSESALECNASSSGTRIAFTPAAQPPTGVDVWLSCD
jgi:hypothetical protein